VRRNRKLEFLLRLATADINWIDMKTPEDDETNVTPKEDAEE
jgi:hypothetical protein